MGATTMVDTVRAAQQGDMAAFARLYDDHRALVGRIVGGRLRDREAAADAEQDTFTKAIERLGGLRDASRFSAWLAAIARNVAVDHARRRNRVRPLSPDVAEAIVEHRAGPEELAEHADLAAAVRRHVRHLPRRHAEVLALSACGASVAGALGVSSGAARIALHRARTQLRTLLNDYPTTEIGALECNVA